MNTAALFLLTASCSLAATSPLLDRGYTVIPQPQKVNLRPADLAFGRGWRLEAGPGVGKSSVALESLRERIEFAAGADKAVRLEIAAGSVLPGPHQDRDADAIAAQAYRLELSPTRIRISANADAGLFYGVQTLLQLAKPANGALSLPEGEIVDWPDLQQRNIYWDDAHHLDRLPELKRAVRQAAFFKINGFAIKLEGHFQYRSAPAIVEPYALTPAEFQELTDYGLRYHVQVIPFLDAPAHIAFILKHPEYTKLRASPDSNYEACTTNPDYYKVLFGMFDDLLAANKGVKYFVLSTDEPYYVGMADNPQCNEASRAKELGSVGKVLAEFVTKAAGYLHDRGRTVSFWGEYPLKPGDISALPSHIINGETYGPQYDPLYKAHGIRQMIYTSTQGEEQLFPTYFVLPVSRRVHRERSPRDRVPAGFGEIANSAARKNADLMGVFVAAWADEGLHQETFWLGYTTIAAAGWNPHSPDPREAMTSFHSLFYGPNVQRMDRVYQLMSYQAQTWSDTWDRIDSTSRKPIWGNSDRIYKQRRPAHDESLPLPALPESDLSYTGAWSHENEARLRAADAALAENDELVGLLNTNLRLAEHNAYSLQVFLTIANLSRHNLDFLHALASMDTSLAAAGKAAKEQNHRGAVASIDRALQQARQLRATRDAVLRETTTVWQKTWFPRAAQANGRSFVHELDDVKDHLPDRTVDMSYLVLREQLLPMGDWYARVQNVRNSYAQSHNLPTSTEPLNW